MSRSVAPNIFVVLCCRERDVGSTFDVVEENASVRKFSVEKRIPEMQIRDERISKISESKCARVRKIMC